MQEPRHVGVADMLHARDQRVRRQQAFQSRHASPLISFTMNIAGSIKCDALIRRAFDEGAGRIARQLERMGCAVMESAQSVSFTGCEMLWAVRADARALKKSMCVIEEADALGRLFDIDVIDENGEHLSRGAERRCLICGGPVRACARSRAHSAEELFQKAHQIIESHFRTRYICKIGELAQKALMYEALTTPKPGLVDCENSGAHRDMDLFSFAGSACALRSYFEACARMGMENAEIPQLQYAGMQAEDEMIAAAKANTHKGAIFSLGILCHAAGSCGEGAALSDLLAKAAQTGTHFLDGMKASKHSRTGGERQYLQYGLTGARGEAASGFQTVRRIALPALEKGIAGGKPLAQAGLDALLALMAQVQDSNIIRRSGMEGQHWAMAQARQLLDGGYTTEDLRRLNDRFVERNISPGGSADLLAAAYFLHFLAAHKPTS